MKLYDSFFLFFFVFSAVFILYIYIYVWFLLLFYSAIVVLFFLASLFIYFIHFWACSLSLLHSTKHTNTHSERHTNNFSTIVNIVFWINVGTIVLLLLLMLLSYKCMNEYIHIHISFIRFFRFSSFLNFFLFSDSFDVLVVTGQWKWKCYRFAKTVSNPHSHCSVFLCAYRLCHRCTYLYISCRRSRTEGVVITCKRYKTNRKCVKESIFFSVLFLFYRSIFACDFNYLFVFLFLASFRHTQTHGQCIKHISSDPRSLKSCKSCLHIHFEWIDFELLLHFTHYKCHPRQTLFWGEKIVIHIVGIKIRMVNIRKFFGTVILNFFFIDYFNTLHAIRSSCLVPESMLP